MENPLKRYEKVYNVLIKRYLAGPLDKYRYIAGIRIDRNDTFHLAVPNKHGDLVLYTYPYLDGDVINEDQLPGQRVSHCEAFERGGLDVAVWIEWVLCENQFAYNEITIPS
jgi:hypothetical protein